MATSAATVWSGVVSHVAATLLLLVHFLPPGTSQVEVHYIHWNASNPIFNDDYVIDIDLGNEPWQYHQANIICPYYQDGSADDADYERYVVHNVTKEEYEECALSPRGGARIVAVCNAPNKVNYFTLTFRTFSPTPSGFQFRPGMDYYLISTSSAGNLYGREGGSCVKDNMKVRFRMRRTGNDKVTENGDTEVSDKHAQSASSFATDKGSCSPSAVAAAAFLVLFRLW
jgi:hypothetical protein